MGNKPINEIKAPELLMTLRRMENCGVIETAYRMKTICRQVSDMRWQLEELKETFQHI